MFLPIYFQSRLLQNYFIRERVKSHYFYIRKELITLLTKTFSGSIGDWNNHFTSEMNTKMTEMLGKNFLGSDIDFSYEGIHYLPESANDNYDPSQNIETRDY